MVCCLVVVRVFQCRRWRSLCEELQVNIGTNGAWCDAASSQFRVGHRSGALRWMFELAQGH